MAFELKTYETTAPQKDTLKVTVGDNDDPFNGTILNASVVLRSMDLSFGSNDHPLKRFILKVTNVSFTDTTVSYDIQPLVKDSGSSYMSGSVSVLIIAETTEPDPSGN